MYIIWNKCIWCKIWYIYIYKIYIRYISLSHSHIYIHKYINIYIHEYTKNVEYFFWFICMNISSLHTQAHTNSQIDVHSFFFFHLFKSMHLCGYSRMFPMVKLLVHQNIITQQWPTDPTSRFLPCSPTCSSYSLKAVWSLRHFLSHRSLTYTHTHSYTHSHTDTDTLIHTHTHTHTLCIWRHFYRALLLKR